MTVIKEMTVEILRNGDRIAYIVTITERDPSGFASRRHEFAENFDGTIRLNNPTFGDMNDLYRDYGLRKGLGQRANSPLHWLDDDKGVETKVLHQREWTT